MVVVWGVGEGGEYLRHGFSMSETVETHVCREHVCVIRNTDRRISVVFLFRWFRICVSVSVAI